MGKTKSNQAVKAEGKLHWLEENLKQWQSDIDAVIEKEGDQAIEKIQGKQDMVNHLSDLKDACLALVDENAELMVAISNGVEELKTSGVGVPEKLLTSYKHISETYFKKK